MRSNRKHTTEELERYIQFYLEEGKSYRELKKDYGLLLAETTFGQNVLRYLEAENAALKKLEEMERELILRKRGMKRSTKQSRSSKKKGSK